VKAKWIDDVTELVNSEEFLDWFQRLESARDNTRLANEKHEELLTQTNLLEFRAELAHRKAIDTLEEANSLADLCADLANQSAELENASFEVVSHYELQREKCTRIWEQIGGLEVREEDSKDRTASAKIKKLKSDYEHQEQEKQRLWGEVERLWIRSIHCNLSLSERQIRARIVRDDAEALFLIHEQERQRALGHNAKAHRMAVERDEARNALETLNIEANTLFSCLVSETFLFWISREDNKFVYAVSLIYNSESYAMPVGPGQVFRCSALTGIDALELVQSSGQFGSLLAPPTVGDVSKRNRKARSDTSEPEGDAPKEKPAAAKKKRSKRVSKKSSGTTRKKKTGTRKIKKSELDNSEASSAEEASVAAKADAAGETSNDADQAGSGLTKSGRKKRARRSKRKKKASSLKPESAETHPPKESDEPIEVPADAGEESKTAASGSSEDKAEASSQGDSGANTNSAEESGSQDQSG
jgi:hypothetical protein